MATKIPKWASAEISDNEFVQLSETYFDMQIWDLHTAICLWVKVNPVSPSGKILSDIKNASTYDPNRTKEQDALVRYFKIALDAITVTDAAVAKAYDIEWLPSVSCPPNPVSAREVFLNPRHFITWLRKKYKRGFPHMGKAEAAYKQRKALKNTKKQKWGNYKQNAAQYREIARKEFLEMVKQDGWDLAKKGIIKPLSVQLNKRLSMKIENPYEPNTLRKEMIPLWISEYLSQQ